MKLRKFAVAKQERRSACGCPSICHQQTPDNIIVSIAEVGIDNFEIDIMNIHANGMEWAAFEWLPPCRQKTTPQEELQVCSFQCLYNCTLLLGRLASCLNYRMLHTAGSLTTARLVSLVWSRLVSRPSFCFGICLQ